MASGISDIVRRLQLHADGQETLSAEEARLAAFLLETMDERIDSHKRMFEDQQRRIGKATRIYKRQYGLPAGVYPSLTDLVDWLMDRYGRKEAAFLRSSLEVILVRLQNLGELSFEKSHTLNGSFLIALRAAVIRALVTKEKDMKIVRDSRDNWDHR